MKNILFILTISLLITSCSKDEMDGPNAQFYGEIVDVNTGERVQQDVFDGSLIRYIELGFKSPPIQSSIFKSDGTFRNNLMFSGAYNFMMYQGNYVSLETIEGVVLKKGENHYTFKVTPYLTLSDVSIEQISETKVKVKFKIQQNTSDKVEKYTLFAHRESAVGNGIHTESASVIVDNNMSPTTEYSVSMNVSEKGPIYRGKAYYFRLGAKSAAPEAKYNYAEAVKLTLW